MFDKFRQHHHHHHHHIVYELITKQVNKISWHAPNPKILFVNSFLEMI